jgi:hypothetical protein
MPGRIYQATPTSKYRYSINGQETTPEIAPNTTTALFWEYDSRIVKRWNVDPILKPWESPYAAFGNNPIRMVDPNGSDWYENNKTHKAKYFKGSKSHKGYIRRGDDNYTFAGSDLQGVTVTSTRKKLPSQKANPEFTGWGEVRDLATNKLEKNIAQIDRSLSTKGFNMDHIDVGMLEGKKSLNTGGKNILGAASTVLDVWDVGVGVHAYATKGGDADIFSSLPLVGGVFSAANDLQNENEKMIVNYALQNGYSNFFQLLTHSTVGRRSGLTGVYVSTDVLKSVIQQGFLDLNLSQIGIMGKTDQFGNDLWSPTPKKYDYFLVFPQTKENKITQFIPLKIN